MRILPLSFALLTISGYWRPVKWKPKSPKYWIYNAYTVFMLFFQFTYAIAGLANAFLVKDLDIFIDKVSLFLSVLGVSLKVTNLLIKRTEIISLTNMLLTERCLPRDEVEVAIKKKFDRNAKIITICCELLNETTAIAASFGELQDLQKNRRHVPSSWVLYSNLSSSYFFWIIWFHLLFGIMISANASVAHETMISGMMIQTSSQLEILSHRLRMLPYSLNEIRKLGVSDKDLDLAERRILGELVEHHLYIYQFSKSVNNIFTSMIFVQFCVSSMVLCMSVYKMSTKGMFTVDFFWTLLYLGCMLMQVFLYCWYGNEVTLKSLKIRDSVYEMDWTSLPVRVTKTLVLIIVRTTRPIIITSGYILTLSASSFMKIMKISYSVYNLLSSR